MTQSLKKIALLIVGLLITIVVLGFANLRNYQSRVSVDAISSVRAYMNVGAAEEFWVSTPDYTLGSVEMMVQYKGNSYYAVVSDKNGLIVISTLLNVFFSPELEVVLVDKVEQ